MEQDYLSDLKKDIQIEHLTSSGRTYIVAKHKGIAVYMYRIRTFNFLFRKHYVFWDFCTTNLNEIKKMIKKEFLEASYDRMIRKKIMGDK